MKRIKSLLAILLAVGLVMAVAVACNDTNDTIDYTITVVDENNEPLAGLTVQVCRLENGVVVECYPKTKTTDKNGQVFFSIKKDNLSAEKDEVEVHILEGLEPYQSYTKKTMRKGESITVNTFENIMTPEGKGTAEYVIEEEQPTDRIDIEAESFDPYKVTGDTTIGVAYKFKFTEEGQKMYIEFNAPLGGNYGDYKVYSISGVDLKVTELTTNVAEKNDEKTGVEKGDLISIIKDANAKTAEGKNFELSFRAVSTKPPFGLAYLEFELNNVEDLGKEFTLCFVFVEL